MVLGNLIPDLVSALLTIALELLPVFHARRTITGKILCPRASCCLQLTPAPTAPPRGNGGSACPAGGRLQRCRRPPAGSRAAAAPPPPCRKSAAAPPPAACRAPPAADVGACGGSWHVEEVIHLASRRPRRRRHPLALHPRQAERRQRPRVVLRLRLLRRPRVVLPLPLPHLPQDERPVERQLRRS